MHIPPYVVLIFHSFKFLTVFAQQKADTYTQSQTPFGPRQCEWQALFMNTIEFPLGGQTELMMKGVRVGNLRQLANQ